MGELNPDALRIISRVSDATHRRYQQFADRDDIYQELFAYYLANFKKFEKWRAGGSSDGYRLMRGLFEAARKFSEREKAAKSGYSFDDVAWYEPELLLKLLPLALNPGWDGLSGESEEAGMPRGKSPQSEAGNLLAMVADIRRALRGSKLRLSDFENNPDHVHNLSIKLGGSYPTAPGYQPVGSRRVISNETAIAQTGSQ